MSTLRPLIKWWLALAVAALLLRAAAGLPPTLHPLAPPTARER